MISLIGEERNNSFSELIFAVKPRLWNEHCELIYEYPGTESDSVIRKVAIQKRKLNDSFIFAAEIEHPLTNSVISLVIQRPGQNNPIFLGRWEYSQGKWASDSNIIPYPSRMIGFNLTNQCNLKCTMCWQKNRTPVTELSFDSIKKVIESVKLLGNPPVYLWGGEPFIHHDLWRIVQLIKESGMFCIINTNGSMLEKFAERIIESKIDMIIVSLDGPEAVHDQIRGSRGIFQRVVTGLERIKQLRTTRRPIISFNCVVTESNYQLFEDMVAVKNQVGAEYLEFQFLIFFTERELANYKRQFHTYFGYEPKSADTYPSSQGNIDLDQLFKSMGEIRAHQDHRLRFFPYLLNDDTKVRSYFENPRELGVCSCENILKSFWVEPNGDVVPCSTFPDYVAGNLYETDFFDIWNGGRFQSFRKKLSQGLFPICYRCCDLYKMDFFQGRW